MGTYQQQLQNYIRQDIPWRKLAGASIMISGCRHDWKMYG